MCRLWHNGMKKVIQVDHRATKEISKFPEAAQLKLKTIFMLLGETGKLIEPYGKKLSGDIDLFGIRVKYKGEWRAIYAYIKGDKVIILSAFAKKTQKTPKTELGTAKKRLLEYL